MLLNKKHTDTLIEQTKTKRQETLDFKMNKQMERFSLNPPRNLAQKGKWLLAVSSSGSTNSIFNITDENKSFSITIKSYWSSKASAKTINKLQKLLQLRS